MTGRLIVMPPAAYARWIAQGAPLGSMAAEGGRLFRSVGCSGCHGANASVHAPNLEGLFRSVVHLDGGGTVVADETYLRDSILEPRKAVVAGYSPIMPSFQGQLDEQQLFALVEYIKSLPAERTRQ